MRCAIARSAATWSSLRRRSRLARLKARSARLHRFCRTHRNVAMIDPNTPPAGDALTQLRARVATPQASATDWLAFGQALLQAAGRNRDQQREALAALVQAYQLDPACDPTLLHTIAQTAFLVRDWPSGRLRHGVAAGARCRRCQRARLARGRRTATQRFRRSRTPVARGRARGAGQSGRAAQARAVHQGTGALCRSRNALAARARTVAEQRTCDVRPVGAGNSLRALCRRLGALRIAHRIWRRPERRPPGARRNQHVLAG